MLRADARGRVRRSGAQRAEILAAFDASGVSAAEFARLVGVKYPTLAGWLHRRGRPGNAPAVRFVEAAVPPPEAPAPLELELPGQMKLRLTEPGQVPLVVALLRGLASC
jgi:lambda repressor-like predicted transcriptional regulator